MVDTYSMQDPEKYGVSAKSYAAHLMGLCCGMEHGGEAAAYDVIHRWLSGPPFVEKPPLVSGRGRVTVADVVVTATPALHQQVVLQWAASVWDAYSSQHQVARTWLEAASSATRTAQTSGRPGRRRQ